jgi:hypothetical protein
MIAFHLQRANGHSRAAFACMLALAASLILSATIVAGEARHVDAVPVFDCAFGENWDVNYDGWPDRWIRKTGPQHPHYVSIAIQDDADADNKKCLRIDLDGAAAMISSPPIRVLPRFSYVFEAKLKTEAVQHSAVTLALDFCDSQGRVLQTKRSKPYSAMSGWTAVEFEPVEPGNPAIDRVIVSLQVQRGHRGDLNGRVSLAGVRLSRLPRIAVSTNNPANIYTELNSVVVRCELSGIPERDPEIRYQLFDAWNKELQSERFQLNGQLIVDETARSSEVTDGFSKGPSCYEGSTEWRPKIADYGYYRVVVQMLKSVAGEKANEAQRELASRTIYLAVVPPLAMPRQGEFGWTLPQGAAPLSFQDLSRLLPQVGINWLKVPVWFDADDATRGDELIRFVELLGASNIEVVGIIDRPADSEADAAGSTRSIPIAELLSLDSSAWAPALEPVMTRLSLRVRWWQLGNEHDTSFVGFPELSKRIEELRRTLFRFGQDVRLGLSWDWSSADILSGQAATWDFQQMCLDTAPTEQQFDELLSKPRENAALRWVFVEPPRRENESRGSEGTLDARSSEFVRRLIAAKVHGADAIIVANPFNDDNGLMRSSGMPAELLLPWRTTAVMLAGAQYLGQIQLPSGSENRVFLRPDGQVVMAVWNAAPVEEQLYLGDEVRQIDILGRAHEPEQDGREQVIRVGPTPSFVLGLHEAVTRWRMHVSFKADQVPSIFKTPHPNSIRFQNFFPQGVGGSLKIVILEERGADEKLGREASGGDASSWTPDRWIIEPPETNFQLAAGQATEFPFEIRLKNALYGKQRVRIDFNVEAEEQFEFSVYRDMEVGTSDLTLAVNSHLEKDGTMIIEQLMTNSAERLTDLKCYLYAKGRRPERMQVYRLGPRVDRKVYRFADGVSLVGDEMLLEVEELSGPRVLRYRFTATAEASPPRSVGDPPQAGGPSGHDDASAENEDSRIVGRGS